MELSVTTFKASCKWVVILSYFQKILKRKIKSLLKLFYLLGGYIIVSNILVSKVIRFCLKSITGWHSNLGRPATSAASGLQNPPASSSPLCPVHVFLASRRGAKSDSNPQNFQETVRECRKFKLNRKNLRRELSSSQQALKEEIKARHGLQIFKSVLKHWPYPGCLDLVAKTLDESY